MEKGNFSVWKGAEEMKKGVLEVRFNSMKFLCFGIRANSVWAIIWQE